MQGVKIFRWTWKVMKSSSWEGYLLDWSTWKTDSLIRLCIMSFLSEPIAWFGITAEFLFANLPSWDWVGKFSFSSLSTRLKKESLVFILKHKIGWTKFSFSFWNTKLNERNSSSHFETHNWVIKILVLILKHKFVWKKFSFSFWSTKLGEQNSRSHFETQNWMKEILVRWPCGQSIGWWDLLIWLVLSSLPIDKYGSSRNFI